MIQIEVDIAKFKEAKRVLEELGEKTLRRAIADAANRAAKGAYTEGKRRLKQQWGVPYKDTKEAFRHVPAKTAQENPSAYAIFSGASQPLFNFSPQPSNIMGGKTEGGVSALFGGQRHHFKRAFVAEMRSSHRGIFERRYQGKGSKRLPIDELFAISIPKMVEDQKHGGAIFEKIQDDIQKRFEDRFVSNCDRLLADKGFK